MLSVIVALVGCGTSQSTSDTAALPDAALDVLMNVGGTAPDSDTITDAVGELDRRCMVAKGWRVRPPRSASGSSVGQGRTDSLETRRRFGYGIHEAAVMRSKHAQPGGGAPDAYDRWVASLPPRELARFEADAAGPPETQRDFQIDGVGTTNAPTVGCTADANRAIFGSVEAGLRVRQMGPILIGDIRSRTEADPRYAEVFARWSACMSKAGHPARTPEAAKEELEAAVDRQGPTKVLFAREMAMAVADLTCANEVGVQSTLQTITRDVARSLDAEKVRLVMVAIEERSAALARAKQVLANEGGSSR